MSLDDVPMLDYIMAATVSDSEYFNPSRSTEMRTKCFGGQQ